MNKTNIKINELQLQPKIEQLFTQLNHDECSQINGGKILYINPDENSILSETSCRNFEIVA